MADRAPARHQVGPVLGDCPGERGDLVADRRHGRGDETTHHRQEDDGDDDHRPRTREPTLREEPDGWVEPDTDHQRDRDEREDLSRQHDAADHHVGDSDAERGGDGDHERRVAVEAAARTTEPLAVLARLGLLDDLFGGDRVAHGVLHIPTPGGASGLLAGTLPRQSRTSCLLVPTHPNSPERAVVCPTCFARARPPVGSNRYSNGVWCAWVDDHERRRTKASPTHDERRTTMSSGTLPIPHGLLTATIDVLLVEDDDGDALLVVELLDDAFGDAVEVVRARSLAEAMELLRRRSASRPSCTVVDLGLPDAQGLEVVHSVRTFWPSEPLVVFTGLDDESRGLDAVTAGAQDFLVKGRVEPQDLRRAVLYAVERCRADVERAATAPGAARPRREPPPRTRPAAVAHPRSPRRIAVRRPLPPRVEQPPPRG